MKAFDIVPHKRLISTVQSYGITCPPGSRILWVVTAAKEMPQMAMHPPASQSSGIPQGSVLWLVLVIVYIKDLLNDQDLLTWNSTFTFHEGIASIAAEANCSARIIWRTYVHLDTDSSLLFKALGPPHLEHGAPTWDWAIKKDMECLEDVQLRVWCHDDPFACLLRDYPALIYLTFSTDTPRHGMEHNIPTNGACLLSPLTSCPGQAAMFPRPEFSAVDMRISHPPCSLWSSTLHMVPKSNVEWRP